MKLFKAIFFTAVFIGSFSYGRTVYENFQGYDVGDDGIYTGDYFFLTDTGGSKRWAIFVDVIDEDEGIQAGGFAIGEEDWWEDPLFSPGDWAYFETDNLADTGLPAEWFQSHLAIVPNPEVAAANPDNPALVEEVWWYAYNENRYFESQVAVAGEDGSPLNNPALMQPYQKRFFEGDTWDEFEWDEDDSQWVYVGQTTQVDSDFLDSILAVGIQFRTGFFDVPDGEDRYFSIWVDEFAVIPEPGVLMLLLSGSCILLLSRGGGKQRT